MVSAIEVPPREVLWRRDYEIPLKYGVRQPYAENGGPGGFAHAIRNVRPVLEIAHAMEQACPDAWFINFSNPMVRICDAIARYSKIKVVGLCHQIYVGYGMVGYVLADELGIDVPPGPIRCHADPDIWPQLNALARQAVAEGAHPGGRLEPFHLDAGAARSAHRRRPLPALPRALGGVRPDLRAADAAGLRRFWAFPDSRATSISASICPG